MIRSPLASPINTSQSSPLPIRLERVLQIRRELSPLTLPFYSSDGNKIQLWKHPEHRIVASVFDLNGKLQIIPGNRIHNPLNPQQSTEDLLKGLENQPPRNWDLVLKDGELSDKDVTELHQLNQAYQALYKTSLVFKETKLATFIQQLEG